MFDFTKKLVGDGRVHHYRVTHGGTPLPYASVLALWQDDPEFRSLFVSVLRESPFSSYRWETPPVARQTANRDFEFVLVDSPGLARAPDTQAFAQYFTTTDDVDGGVEVFPNVGKDATLVVPSPRTANTAYVHLAAFLRGAPEAQVHELWRVVGKTAEEAISEQPLWLSTAGGGVAWLHVRLDSRPKYYSYRPYTRFG